MTKHRRHRPSRERVTVTMHTMLPGSSDAWERLANAGDALAGITINIVQEITERIDSGDGVVCCASCDEEFDTLGDMAACTVAHFDRPHNHIVGLPLCHSCASCTKAVRANSERALASMTFPPESDARRVLH